MPSSTKALISGPSSSHHHIILLLPISSQTQPLPPPTLAATTPPAPSRRRRWRHQAKPRGRGGGGGLSPAALGSGSAWILVELRETSSRWWGRRRVRIREPELDPRLGKATCGCVGELLAWFPLRFVDLGRVGSPGAFVYQRGRGVSGVCSGVGGLLMLLPFPWPAVVAREWKGTAPPSSSLGLFMVYF
jgi:hypothetical protein